MGWLVTLFHRCGHLMRPRYSPGPAKQEHLGFQGEGGVQEAEDGTRDVYSGVIHDH
jgi:hypothetical protein